MYDKEFVYNKNLRDEGIKPRFLYIFIANNELLGFINEYQLKIYTSQVMEYYREDFNFGQFLHKASYNALDYVNRINVHEKRNVIVMNNEALINYFARLMLFETGDEGCKNQLYRGILNAENEYEITAITYIDLDDKFQYFLGVESVVRELADIDYDEDVARKIIEKVVEFSNKLKPHDIETRLRDKFKFVLDDKCDEEKARRTIKYILTLLYKTFGKFTDIDDVDIDIKVRKLEETEDIGKRIIDFYERKIEEGGEGKDEYKKKLII